MLYGGTAAVVVIIAIVLFFFFFMRKKKYKCKICDLEFDSEEDLRDHNERIHQ